MATYTFTAFDQFCSQLVDLDPDEVKRARASRDYLQGQILTLPQDDVSFPRLWREFAHFGSFARRTRVRPLDDIDLMPLLDGKDTSIFSGTGFSYRIKIQGGSHVLASYSDDGYVNSTKILNKFKAALRNLPNYSRSELRRSGEAVVLNLTSYSWSFDIIPAFPVGNPSGGVDYYCVPDGAGNWKRSDPRRDQLAISEANKYHNGNLLPLIRLIKYWNQKSFAAPRLPSYYLEAMLLAGLRYETPLVSIRRGVPTAFRCLETHVVGIFQDPNGYGPNLDTDVPLDDQKKVQVAAAEQTKYASSALACEALENHKDAIYWWGRVFPSFPKYG